MKMMVKRMTVLKPQLNTHVVRGGQSVGKTQYGNEPDQVIQLGRTTIRFFSPQNLSPEEIAERDLKIHQAIADILRAKARREGDKAEFQ